MEISPRVTTVEPLADFHLLLGFKNGERRVFDVGPYVARGGVFATLRDGRFFAPQVVAGSVSWPGEIDLSYDTLYLRSEQVSDTEQARDTRSRPTRPKQ